MKASDSFAAKDSSSAAARTRRTGRLLSLSIRDVVLIERLDLTFDSGLCVLTGETGAGKSILLDSLGLALGDRAEARLIRADKDQASVTAAFELDPRHLAHEILREQGLAAEDDVLVLRRTLGVDGRSRAFVNDQPVSATFLRSLGESLVEIQGQFEQRGLLDPANHRNILDAYGALEPRRAEVARSWQAWQNAEQQLGELRTRVAESKRDEDLLRHYVDELDRFAPAAGEASELAARRQFLTNAERILTALAEAEGHLRGDESGGGAESALSAARHALERAIDKSAGRLDGALEAIARAEAEVEEALAQLRDFAAEMDLEAGALDEVNERYFALLELARKHGCDPDSLPQVLEDQRNRLDAVTRGESDMAELENTAAKARQTYEKHAQALSLARRKSAKSLDKAVNAELPPLKLAGARFGTRVDTLEPTGWGRKGMDRVTFEIATNNASIPGPLNKVASGGELARFLLALKVILAQVNPEQVLVFDEVDSGVGGATAHAVGERLEQLAEDRQVLVVTHSPQVAARGTHHWQVFKRDSGAEIATQASRLDSDARREEIARMLSGAEVTEEARAAATRLMGMQ